MSGKFMTIQQGSTCLSFTLCHASWHANRWQKIFNENLFKLVLAIEAAKNERG